MDLFTINNFPNNYFNEAISLSKLKGKAKFVQKFISSFHDYDNLYFVSKYYDGFMMDYLNFDWNEDQIRFFSACLIESFNELRKEKLIHRDVHLANLVLDENQYINLIDFHIAIEYEKKNDPKNNFVGSPQYCAPEMIKKENYDYNSDYYRLGGMIYFIIFKDTPNEVKMRKNTTDISIVFNTSLNFSYSCIDFINKLIVDDYRKRIGFYNLNELKNHEFFKYFDWENLEKKKLKSPFKKIKGKNNGLCNKKYKYKKHAFISTRLLKNKTFKNIFFTYDNIDENLIFEIFEKSIYNNYK